MGAMPRGRRHVDGQANGQTNGRAQAQVKGQVKWAGRWLLYVTSVLAVIGQHAPLIGYKTYANVDEAYAMALASRLMDGQTLYVGAVSQRGPLMYYAYQALASVV